MYFHLSFSELLPSRLWTLMLLFFHQSLAQQSYTNRVVDKFASCDDNFIYFTISFERPFVGAVYTDGAFGVSRCTYVNGTAFSSTKYNVTIPLNDCKSQRFPNGTRQNVLIVQQDARILEASDNMYIVTCTPGGGGTGGSFGPNQRFTLSFLGITVQGTLGSSEVITNAATSVDYTVEVQMGRGPSGKPLDRVLNVGEPLSYVVKLKNLQGVDARVGRCWATDRVSADIQLSDDEGCTLQAGTNIWNNFKSASAEGSSTKILYNDIKTWAFPTSNRVNILCNLHVCPGTCPSVSCSTRISKDEKPVDGILRRRALESEKLQISGNAPGQQRLTEEDMIRLEGGYTVSAYRQGEQFSADFYSFHNPGLVTAALNATEDEIVYANRKVCLSYSNFIVGIVLLLVIIFVSFIFIVFMLVRMYRMTHGRRQSRNNASRTNTLHSHSSDDVEK